MSKVDPGGGGGHPSYLPRPGGKEIEVEPGFLRSFANKMQRDLDNLIQGRYKEQVEDALPPSGALGDYQAGRGLYQTVQNGHNNVSATFDQFTKAYQQVIDALRRSAENYENAEQNNSSRFRNTYGGNPGSGGAYT